MSSGGKQRKRHKKKITVLTLSAMLLALCLSGAKQIGPTIPQSALFRADKVIK